MNTSAQPRARRLDPTTSHLAADRVKTRTPAIRNAVLGLARTFPQGFTHRQMVALYKRNAGRGQVPPATDSSVRSRVHELVQSGDIIDTGKRHEGRTRAEIIWRAVP